LFYFKHESALQEGIRSTVEDANIESAGALDPDPPTITSAGAHGPHHMSTGAIDPTVTSAGALILLTPVITVTDIIIRARALLFPLPLITVINIIIRAQALLFLLPIINTTIILLF